MYARFRDLVEANIVRNWPQLQRLIEIEGFPQGIRLSRNARAWEIGEVRDWLAGRPQAGQGEAGLRGAPADLKKIGTRSQREGSGRAQPIGKPRKGGCGCAPFEEEEARHES